MFLLRAQALLEPGQAVDFKSALGNVAPPRKSYSIPLGAPSGADFEALWASPACAGLHHTPLAKSTFLQFWAARAAFLYDLRQFQLSEDRAGRPNPVTDANRVSWLYERLGFVFLAECIQLSDRTLRRNWADPRRQSVWSIRGSDITRPDRFSLLCLTQGVSESHSALASELLDRVRDLRAKQELKRTLALRPAWADFVAADAATRVALLGPLVVLRPHVDPEVPGSMSLPALLAPAFGQPDAERFESVLSSLRYTLSADFALKLLILNERRRAGANVILCGDTGEGCNGPTTRIGVAACVCRFRSLQGSAKASFSGHSVVRHMRPPSTSFCATSSLPRIVAAVINADSDHIPVVVDAIKAALKKCGSARADSFPTFASRLQSGGEVGVGAAAGAGTSPALDAIASESDLLEFVQATLGSESDGGRLLDALGDDIARYLFSFFVRYPVMQV